MKKTNVKNRFEIIQFFQEIENQVPVDKWVIKKMHIYPIMRIMIGFNLISSSLYKNTPSKKHSISKIKNYFFRIIEILKAKSAFKRLRNTDIIFLGSHTHDVFWKKRRYNKFFEPLIENNSLYSSTYLQSTYGFERSLNNRKFSQALLSATFDHSLKNIFIPNKENEFWWNEFILLPGSKDFLNQINIQLGISADYVYLNIIKCKKIFELSLFYEKVIKKTQPVLAMALNFYSPHGLAFIFAANKLGVPSVDMQHGSQLEGNIAYSFWKRFPEEGYNVLPNFFWCWDAESKKAIENWNKSPHIHQSLLGGNPWLAYHKNKKINRYKSNTPLTILYTLQPIPTIELFPPYLTNFITSHLEYKWNIRFHPRQDTIQRDEIVNLFKNRKRNINFEDGFDTPLPISILNAKIHITNFSSTTIEAAQFGTKTIILHYIGNKMFADLIRDKVAYYLENKDYLRNLLLTAITSKNVKSKIPDSDEVFNKIMETFSK